MTREASCGRDLVPEGALKLLSAYATSASDICRQAADLDQAVNPALGPVSVRALVSDVGQRLDALALGAGLVLLRDTGSGCDGVCCADPAQLRGVLMHLVLRALSMEQASGHVRLLVSFTLHEAHILILSRTPEAILACHANAARHDLVAPQRLLKAMGGSLVLEPRRGGYLPLCIALPALCASPALRVA